MEGRLTVTMGPVIAYGWESPQPGINIRKDGWKNWTGGVDIRRDENPILGGDGDYAADSDLAARYTPISAYVDAPTFDDLDLELANLRALQQKRFRDNIPVTVEENGQTRTATGSLFGQMDIKQDGGIPFADITMTLKFRKPQMFGEPRKSGPTAGTPLNLTHRGNSDAPAIISVQGSNPANSAYTVYGGDGGQFIISRRLVPGETHQLHTATGRLYVNGVRTTGGILKVVTWTVPADGVGNDYYIDVPGGSVSAWWVDTKDTWV